jgi:NAD-dependent SIR2 family protein deacetylase
MLQAETRSHMPHPFTPSETQSAFERAAFLINRADALLVAAGAGMGVDSGLPDFRGKEGFWRAYPALRESQTDFYRIACPAAFHSSPERAWGFYGHRLALYRRTQPHPGFELLRRWGQRMARGMWVFTSNVDGQFQKAGFDADRIHECHGSIHHLQCLGSCSSEIWPADAFEPDVDEQNCLLRNSAPRCPRCGGLARPNILMFGDGGWLQTRSAAQERRLYAWLSTVERLVVIELGAGTAIPSVRSFADGCSQQLGARIIRINPQESQVLAREDVGLPTGALNGLQSIAEILGPDFV